MNKQEQKEWIKKRWKVSNGKRITEMLLHYFELKEPKQDIVSVAKEIFNT